MHCHVFMLLEEPCHPTLLKNWLKYINLSTSQISSGLCLSKSQNSLLWPLDITTCQNDKLLYIAPPIFHSGVKDPFSGKQHGRVSLQKNTFRTLDLDLSTIPTQSIIQNMELGFLNTSRKAANLKPRKTFVYKNEMDIKYLDSPDPAQVTGIKTERDFVYLNLNGGDSWGYYHPINNPTFIYNFKGEAVYRTQDLLPTYWEEIKTRVQNCEPDAGGNVYLAFRDFESATYWNGIYDSPNKRLTKLAQARSESQLRHFMKQHGQPLGDFIPDWEMTFSPSASFVVDQKNKLLNMYRPSKYFVKTPTPQLTVPPTIHKVIHHVLGSEPILYEHFMNWLAVIAQHLTMTQTAWVVHGTQGTGKGVMFNHILTPLFGMDNVTSRRMEEIGSDFTEFMKNKFIVFIDEVSAGKTLFHDKITAKLKNLIVEPRISVREMYKPSAIMQNFTNLIFASNSPQPMHIAADDRRFNVGNYQKYPIDLTGLEIDTLALEITEFYNYLHTRTADADKARAPIMTDAKRNIINLSRPSIDIAIEALKEGNMSFFLDLLVENTDVLSPRAQIAHQQYYDLIMQLQASGQTKITRDNLFIIFGWCLDKIPESPNKFATMLRHHGLELVPIWVNNKTVRGYDVKKWV